MAVPTSQHVATPASSVAESTPAPVSAGAPTPAHSAVQAPAAPAEAHPHRSGRAGRGGRGQGRHGAPSSQAASTPASSTVPNGNPAPASVAAPEPAPAAQPAKPTAPSTWAQRAGASTGASAAPPPQQQQQQEQRPPRVCLMLRLKKVVYLRQSVLEVDLIYSSLPTLACLGSLWCCQGTASTGSRYHHRHCPRPRSQRSRWGCTHHQRHPQGARSCPVQGGDE